MEDRLRFRMYDKENKIMLYEDSEELRAEGLYEYEELWWATTAVPISAISYFFDHNCKERFVLQQCTGLKDRNGKLIYEGDIVKVKGYGIDRIFVIYWDDAIAQFTMSIYNSDCFEHSQSVMEVIGNIYENKELLKEQK